LKPVRHCVDMATNTFTAVSLSGQIGTAVCS
jgi:hypothetical protein